MLENTERAIATSEKIQRNWQHWVHNAQDEDKQAKYKTQYVLDTTFCTTQQFRHFQKCEQSSLT